MVKHDYKMKLNTRKNENHGMQGKNPGNIKTRIKLNYEFRG